MNLLAQWVSFLRQVTVAQVLGDSAPASASGERENAIVGAANDVVFEGPASKAFGGVWDDDLFLKLKGKTLQYARLINKFCFSFFFFFF